MPYVEKCRKQNIFDYENLHSVVDNLMDCCRSGDYSNAEVKLANGTISIEHVGRFSSHSPMTANLTFKADEIPGLIGGHNELINYRADTSGKTTKDSMAVYFEKAVDAALITNGEVSGTVNIPLSINVYPGRIFKDDDDFIIRKGIEHRFDVEIDDEGRPHSKKSSPLYVMEVGLSEEKMENLNGRYAARRGIDKWLHNRAKLMSGTAKAELGFDVKERHDPNGNKCFSQICVCPKEFLTEEIPEELARYLGKDSFTEMIINMKNDEKNGARGFIDMEMKKAPGKDEFLVKYELSGMPNTLPVLLHKLPLSYPQEAQITYRQFESSELGDRFFYAMGEAAGVAVAGLKAGAGLAIGGAGYIIDHVKDYRDHRAERISGDNEIVDKYLLENGIFPNSTRTGSCMIQVDEKQCIANSRLNKERKEQEKLRQKEAEAAAYKSNMDMLPGTY